MRRSGKLLDAIGQIDDRYIMEAADIPAEKEDSGDGKKAKTVPMRWRKRAAAFAGLAACAAVAVWAMDQGTGISPFEARTEKSAAPEAAMDTGTEAMPEAAMDTETAAMPEEVPEAAAEPYAYSAVNELSDAGERMGTETGEALRSASAAMEIPAARVSASQIQTDARTLTCMLTSEDTENTLVFGSRYYLEYLTEDGWQEISPVGEIGWEEQACELGPGESMEKSWDLEVVYGRLGSGQYRIAIPCEEQNGDGSAAAVIYVEFGI